jgi:mono/diheme cytochrome c family protein
VGAAEPPAEEPPLDPQLVAKALHEEAERLARERGERYLKSRAGCADCHGDDFGGKVIIDALPVMGRWVAPNITRGGVTRNYTSADWVRIIRHGIRKNGQVATMPARDFTWLSDQELSDMAVYIESLPPVDRVMPPSEFGPVFAMLITKGDFPIDAERIDHEAARPKLPPELAVTEELGRHLALTCQGCHGPRFAGGPIPGGDPSWPPAANLTPHESGLSGWSKDDFFLSLREGKRPDGRNLHPAMPIPYTKNLTDEETESLYRFFMDLEALPTGTM